MTRVTPARQTGPCSLLKNSESGTVLQLAEKLGFCVRVSYSVFVSGLRTRASYSGFVSGYAFRHTASLKMVAALAAADSGESLIRASLGKGRDLVVPFPFVLDYS
jgi:hypothetical protein